MGKLFPFASSLRHRNIISGRRVGPIELLLQPRFPAALFASPSGVDQASADLDDVVDGPLAVNASRIAVTAAYDAARGCASVARAGPRCYDPRRGGCPRPPVRHAGPGESYSDVSSEGSSKSTCGQAARASEAVDAAKAAGVYWHGVPRIPEAGAR